MTSLFHFEDRVHHRSLPRAESMPLLFPRLLCQVLEHIGFPTEPRLEHRRGCEATLSVDRWRARPRAFHLPPPRSNEDEPTADSPQGDLSPIAEHTEEPPAPASSVPPPVPSAPPTTSPVASAPVPQAPMPSTLPKPSAPMPTARSGIAGLSTSGLPQQYITLSTRVPDYHGGSPHILRHCSIICSFPSHTCREDDSHRGCRSIESGHPLAAPEPLRPPCCLSAYPYSYISYTSHSRISSSIINLCRFLGCVGSRSSISHSTSSTSACPG